MKNKSNRKIFFRFVKIILRIVKKKPEIVMVKRDEKGEMTFLTDVKDKLYDQSIYLCNHVGAKCPSTLEVYFPKQFRFWGTHEMTEGTKARYIYLSTIYFHEKRHVPKLLAKIIAFLITPLMGMFYKGLQLIPTYRDNRLLGTIKKSVQILKTKQSIIIFPEDSHDGYHDVLTEYFSGFFILAKKCYKEGIDVYIYNMYFQRRKKILLIDEPIKYSELIKISENKEEIAEMFRIRANELGKTIIKK